MSCVPWILPPTQYALSTGNAAEVVRLAVPSRGNIVRLSIVNDLATAGSGTGINMEFEIYTLAAAAYTAAGISPIPYLVGPPYQQAPQVLIGHPMHYSVTGRVLGTNGLFVTPAPTNYQYANYDGSRASPEPQLWLLIFANKTILLPQTVTISGVIEPVSIF